MGGGRELAARLRAAPSTAALLAVVVLVTAFLAALAPGAVAAEQDGALRSLLASAPLAQQEVSLTEAVADAAGGTSGADPVGPARIAAVRAAFVRDAGPDLPLTVSGAATAYGARLAVPQPATDPGLPRLGGPPSRAQLFAQAGLSGRARLLSGRWPATAPAGSAAVEAVVTERTARTMDLRAGSAVHLADAAGGVLTVRISGVVAPRGSGTVYWNAEQALAAPARTELPNPKGGDPSFYWRFGLLIAPGSAPALLRLPGGARLYWHRELETGDLTAARVPDVAAALASLDDGPALVRLQTDADAPDLAAVEGLDDPLASFAAERAATRPLMEMTLLGAGTAAAVVLLLTAAPVAARRRAEFALLRSRGASLRQLAGGLLGQGAVVVLPAALAGTLAARAAVPGAPWWPSAVCGGAVAVVAVAALPAVAVVAHRVAGPAGGREEEGARRPSRGRSVLEAAVAVVAAGAVVAVRWRGTADGGGLLPAAAPVLLSAVGALVLVRLFPWPVRLLTRAVLRTPGAVAPLGLARAARGAGGRAALLAVLVAPVVAAVGGSVLSAVDTAQDRAAVTLTGADARIDAPRGVPAVLARRVAALPGVRDVTGVRAEEGQQTVGQAISYTLLEVDPAGYARLARSTGIGPLPAGALTAPAAHGVLPAVVSPALARQFGASSFPVEAQAGWVRVRAAAVADATPAAPDTDFVIVARSALVRAHPAAAALTASTALYVTGHGLAGAPLAAAARGTGASVSVSLESARRASFGTPLESGALRICLAGAVAGAGYAALALLLSLLREAPARVSLLARLRVMGLSRGQARGLVALEVAPRVLLGVAGGVALGAVAVLVLAPEVSVGVLAFGTADPGAPVLPLRPDAAALLLPAAGMLLCTGVVTAAQVWRAGRRSESTELRFGDGS